MQSQGKASFDFGIGVVIAVVKLLPYLLFICIQ